MRLFIPAAIGAVLLAACASVPSQSSLLGRWAPQSAELNGAPLAVSAFDGAQLNLTADTYEFGIDRGSYVLASGSPPKMDIDGKSGPNAGRHIPAIWSVDGDSLTIAYQLAGGDRPATFASPAGARVLLVRYKRTT
jgi:uncharacterized protein (TIGR03067 family)